MTTLYPGIEWSMPRERSVDVPAAVRRMTYSGYGWRKKGSILTRTGASRLTVTGGAHSRIRKKSICAELRWCMSPLREAKPTNPGVVYINLLVVCAKSMKVYMDKDLVYKILAVVYIDRGTLGYRCRCRQFGESHRRMVAQGAYTGLKALQASSHRQKCLRVARY
jgi:hypothetical protein